ncbi:5-oxoprolinase subunit C family protein [Pseudomonas sp. Marseille-QA0892]
MNALRVEQSTPLVTLQDSGRFGVRHLGVTQGGALDWVSLHWANWLLGNPLGAAAVEITLGSFTVEAMTNVTLVIGGADLGATVGGQPQAPWQPFELKRGQRLAFTQPRRGARAYLTAPGGFTATQVMDSVATVHRESLGGLDGDGEPLKTGDILTCLRESARVKRAENHRLPDFSRPAALDLVLGAQIGDFAGESLFDAFNSQWRLDSRGDRMGIRLLGPVLRCLRTGMVSEGIPLGAVQVPADGQPIVLMNDRQTIGGYPRLGALTPASVARLAQCLPDECVTLRPVGQDAAQRAHRQLLAQWNQAADRP